MAPPVEILVHRASRAQQRMWFGEQVTPGEPVNHINLDVWFDEALDAGALRAALADVIDRHEALRTAFRAQGGTLQQVVVAPSAPPLTMVELAGAPGERAAAYRELRERTAAAPFDLAEAPLLRAVHVRAPDGDAVVLVIHHMVADAWSLGIVLSELSRAYAARRAGRDPGWEPLPVQYADFTAWQENWLAQPESQRHLAYWRERLAGVPTLDLTLGRPRPERAGAAGLALPIGVDAGLRERLEAFVRSERATPFMGALAVYAAALGRVFGGQDVAISSAVVGRPVPEVEGLVGLFVDRVVLRIDLSGRPGFRELLARARRAVTGAYDHDQVTFDQVVDAVQPERRLGVTPLAQAAINLVPRPVVSPDGGLPRPVDGATFAAGTVPHDLGLELAEGQEWQLEYRPAVVDDGAARRVAALVARLLEAGLTAPDRPLCLVPALDPGEARVWDGGNGTGPPARPVHELVAAWARRTPDAPAVAGPSGTLTYAELDAAARSLAGRLRQRGAGPETTVLLALPRSVDLVVAMLGVLAAGAAYVPVDPGDPPDHIDAVARQARAALRIDAGDPILGAGGADPADAGRPPAGERSAAYVLFTSGSSGPPKGVVVEHRSLAAYVRALLDRLQPPPGAVHLMLQSPTFDSCLTAIFGALCSGGTLRLVDDEAARDGRVLAERLAGRPADYLKITPSHLAALLAGGDAEALRPRGAVIVGGEPCGRALVRRLRDGGWRVLDEYGPTETTVGVLSRWLEGADGGAPWAPSPPIGDPLPGVRAAVLDPDGEPVPPGCAGELHVAGPLVARGYLGQPARTAEAFRPDPFGGEPGGRMYATGDLVRPLADGTCELLGRRDRQVKVRGVRVELGAVEAALERLPGVARAAATLRGGRLDAYVVPAPGAALEPGEVRAQAGRRLPAAALPSSVTVLDALPLTRHGKLDEEALPDPARAAPGRREAPATPTETALAGVWRDALGVAEVGVTERFFDVGGDSILAIQVVAEARRRGLALTVQHLFDEQAIAPIAARLDAEAEAGETAPARGDAVDAPGGAEAGFPDAGLDEAGLARLLASLMVEPEPEE